MPSVNGLFDVPDPTNFNRSWGRVIIVNNTSNPGWPADPSGWYYEIFSSLTPGGPYTPATLTSVATECIPVSGNRVNINPAQQGTTAFGVGGPGVLTPETDYWGAAVLFDQNGVERDRFEVPADDPWTPANYPSFACVINPVEMTTAHMLLGSDGTGEVNIQPPCDVDSIVWEHGPSATGPWTSTASEPVDGLSPEHTFTGLTPDTTYFARARLSDAAGTEYLVTTPCSFTTQEAAVTTPPFEPQPCCDAAASASCMEPMQFCQTGTSTAPAEHPGRMYDITLPINPGFAVASLTVDAVTNPAGITWEVDDPDGAAFAATLQTFIQGRVAGSTVTITNPNAGTPQVCGTALPMQIHIECLRLDQNPPNLIELIYNAGRDMIQNPAYNEFPALNPPAAQGNYGFRLLSRQDDPGPFPGNPPANDALCTSVANRGWETNDVGRTFEIWGQDITGPANVTPTPRGTPVQEMASDGPPPGARSTIWQTFVAPSSGNFNIRVVHGARDPGENHRITLTPGDTGDVQGPGAIINDVTTPPSVTSNGGPNPWTTFAATIPLVSGQTYTLALSTNNPALFNRGGLFTDMRAFLDVPDQRATAVNNDDTCVVTTNDTTTTTTCTFWQPTCTGGTITGWTNVQTGTTITNDEFWAQTPTPSCCSLAASSGEGGGGTTNANLAVSDTVCVVVGGIPSNAIRVVVLDPSGGQLSQQFLGPDGFPVTPDSWVAGACTTNRTVFDVLLCDTGNIDAQGQPTVFLRKYVQSLDAQLQGNINSHRDFMVDGSGTYTVVGPVRDCASFPMVDREAACWTQTSTGATVHTGTIRHDDTLPFPGWLLFDQNVTPVPSSTPGLTFIPCGTEDFTTTGLCLGDGTPIGIINRRTGTGTIVRDGWINLLTGAFSVGNPPPGASACGSTVNVQTSDVLCDIDPPTGDVLNLVLIQYNYNPDGSIASTEILDATTGLPYTPVGNITVCPTDQGQPDRDMELLCDVLPNGTVVSIVRDYIRDVNGVISGFADYLVNGTPYTPVGTVTICIPRDMEAQILCDAAGTRFLRSYLYAPTGSILSFTDTALNGAPFTPTAPVSVCPLSTSDTEQVTLCDDNGTFVRRFTYDAAGAVTSTGNLTISGSPYVPVGNVSFGCTTPSATSQIIANCADVGHSQFANGGNLLINGNFEQSSGQGASSIAGPGWVTGYTACGPDLFTSPCGANSWSYFTTTASQVMSSGASATVEALGSRSFAVNVGPNVNLPIIEWQNVYLENGKTYELSADAAIVFAPFDVALKVGGAASPGGLFPLSTPPTGNWGKTTTTFTYALASGYTSVGLYSNNAAAGGNDHTFDNISLREITPASAEVTTPVVYSGTQRALIDQVVETAGCNDDRRDALLGRVIDAVAPRASATLDSTLQRQTGAGSVAIATGARSVTVVVLTGPVTLNLGQGVTSLPTGVELTWAVDGPGEALFETFSFTGVAGSDFLVTSTRQ